MRKILLGFGIAVFIIGSASTLYGQTKGAATKSSPKSTNSSKMATFTFRWRGKTYSMTTAKSFPWKEVNGVFQTAAGVPSLKLQLYAARSETQRLRESNLNTKDLAAELRQAETRLQIAEREVEDSKAKLEETMNELDEAQNELEELKEDVNEVKSSVSDVGFELGRLKRSIDGFAFLDWKSVVSDVQNRFRSLRYEFETLETKTLGLP